MEIIEERKKRETCVRVLLITRVVTLTAKDQVHERDDRTGIKQYTTKIYLILINPQ